MLSGRIATFTVSTVAALTSLVALPAIASAEPGGQCHTAARLDTGRLGIGGAVGHEWQIDERDADQLSLIAQYRLTPRTTVEVELGRTEYHDSNDVDRRLGGALAIQVGQLGFLSPYIVGGGGSVDRSAGRHLYAEAGAGVKFPLSRHVVLMLDVRSGRHFGAAEETSGFSNAGDSEAIPLSSGSGTDGNNTVTLEPRDIDYSRWRLMGVVYF